MAAAIQKSTLNFLKDLEKNNNRPWFHDNKDRYELVKENAKSFLEGMVSEMNKVDDIEKSKLFRIYRDVRFSKDKTPYNTQVKFSMGRAKPHLRGGYFLAIGHKESFIAGGFWNPESKDLKLIRDNIAADPKRFEKSFGYKKFKDHFGTLQGDTLKSAPKGFDKEHPAIEHLRRKQFIFTKKYTTKEVLDKHFYKQVVKDYKVVRPFYDYMSDILGHDMNGVPLY